MGVPYGCPTKKRYRVLGLVPAWGMKGAQGASQCLDIPRSMYCCAAPSSTYTILAGSGNPILGFYRNMIVMGTPVGLYFIFSFLFH